MLTIRQDGEDKWLQCYVKRGLSWVPVEARSTWGKVDGVWRRGARKKVLVSLTPSSSTVYWDIDIWEQLGHPTEPLDVQIHVGKHAIIAQSFVPSPESIAAYLEANPGAVYIPALAALELTGGWHLDTTFDVYLSGALMGCSGYGAEPVQITKQPQPDVVPDHQGPDLLITKATESGVDMAVAMVPSQDLAGKFSASYGSFTYSAGVVDGFFAPGKKGGRGGAGLRTNRPTTVHIQTTPQGQKGAVAGGGGGGGSIGSFWRRYYGGVVMVLAREAVSGGAEPDKLFSQGDAITFSNARYPYQQWIIPDSDYALTKQWALAGWGGAMGAGATLVHGTGPNSPVTLQAHDNSQAAAQHSDFLIVNPKGRLAPAWPRKGAVNTGNDGYNGTWYWLSASAAYATIYFNAASVPNRDSINGPAGRSAGSGHTKGASISFGTSAEIKSDRKVLPNDFINALRLPAPAATVSPAMAKYAAYAVPNGPMQLNMYERSTSAAKFSGGKSIGSYPLFYVANAFKEHVFHGRRFYYVRARNNGDGLVQTSITAGEGGKLGKAGTAAVLNYGGSLSWETSNCAGYSHFPVLAHPYKGSLAGAGGEAGPAIIGSEYVTIVGDQHTAGDVKSITGAIIPFE